MLKISEKSNLLIFDRLKKLIGISYLSLISFTKNLYFAINLVILHSNFAFLNFNSVKYLLKRKMVKNK